MDCEAIILAGGLGTRLQHVVKDAPKPMAMVNGKPFLYYIFRYLQQQSISKVILSVGHKAEVIRDYFGKNFDGIEIKYIYEEEPLGTGGAIRKSLMEANNEVVILNGDTFYPIPLNEIRDKFHSIKADIVIALKPLKNFDRYGTVEVNNEGRITSFIEKKYCKEGLINGGIYYTSKALLDKLPGREKFSFENDFMNVSTSTAGIYSLVSDEYFIDIGVPEDYERAQRELKDDNRK